MKRKILIVEDHDSLRYLMGAFLSRQFEVVGAKNGLDAMSWLGKGQLPDVIVTDMSMPALNGAELLDNLRCSGLYADIPVVVISGREDDEEEKRIKQLGARAYLRKPFSPTELQDRLLQLAG
ncbi:MAG: response regulator [Saprospiraceae bacterium]|nr:response regulator [Saprospiraceae bacterium]MCB0544285.1 response regulator [Saprospiraceae bacterium]MCB0576112.1 response regulator [Saprospiraceae bacterium]MCB9304991.1 response regulator [Lewinellaceae bacterium]MCB9353270.1 response regulator [Lewinellaceae bacterium]